MYLMSLQQILLENTQKAIAEHYGQHIENIEIQLTRKEFEGDYTLVGKLSYQACSGGYRLQCGQRLSKPEYCR